MTVGGDMRCFGEDDSRIAARIKTWQVIERNGRVRRSFGLHRAPERVRELGCALVATGRIAFESIEHDVVDPVGQNGAGLGAQSRP